ncbi:MAG: rhodanese-related sulfurtransferase [Alphaproteobacteria bacterium]|nr:rhodanese-related sulfurtransferase [Alphaproteobacteria bacterium]
MEKNTAPKMENMDWTVAALYRFVALENLPKLQKQIKTICDANDICGTLLIAPEGINGTIAGQGQAIHNIIDCLEEIAGVSEGELKYSHAKERPFRRIKVRLKKEIITMKAPEADPTKKVGTYVSPEQWNDLINDPEVTLIDTRNNYETAVGIFKGAIDPQIETFTQFKDYVHNNMDPKKQKKVAMFCTGGIRCEKASSYMLAHGFEEVYHLKGGILKYLEDVPSDQSQWEGDCFVFDRRVAIGHNLEESPYQICYGCRFPLSPEDLQQSSYEKGVSCPHCIDKLTPERERSFRMRHEQMKKMGEVIPGDSSDNKSAA